MRELTHEMGLFASHTQSLSTSETMEGIRNLLIRQATVDTVVALHGHSGIASHVALRCHVPFRCTSLSELRRKVAQSIPWTAWLCPTTAQTRVEVIQIVHASKRQQHAAKPHWQADPVADQVQRGIDIALGRRPVKGNPTEPRNDATTAANSTEIATEDDAKDSRTPTDDDNDNTTVVVPIHVRIVKDFVHITIPTSTKPLYLRQDDDDGNDDTNATVETTDPDTTTPTASNTNDNNRQPSVVLAEPRPDLAHAMAMAMEVVQDQKEEMEQETNAADQHEPPHHNDNTTTTVIVDPYCGSTSTLMLEACQRHLQLPPGRFRSEAPLRGTKLYQPEQWRDYQQRAMAQARAYEAPTNIQFVASDREASTVAQARAAAQRQALAEYISFSTTDTIEQALANAHKDSNKDDDQTQYTAEETKLDTSGRCRRLLQVLTKPPYSKPKRVRTKAGKLRKSYRHLWPSYQELGQACATYNASTLHILSSNVELVKKVGLSELRSMFVTDQGGSHLFGMHAELATNAERQTDQTATSTTMPLPPKILGPQQQQQVLSSSAAAAMALEPPSVDEPTTSSSPEPGMEQQGTMSS